jgi:hypothetical protein
MVMKMSPTTILLDRTILFTTFTLYITALLLPSQFCVSHRRYFAINSTLLTTPTEDKEAFLSFRAQAKEVLLYCFFNLRDHFMSRVSEIFVSNSSNSSVIEVCLYACNAIAGKA